MNIICLIKVVTLGVPFLVNAEIEGRIISEFNQAYYVNFFDNVRKAGFKSDLTEDKRIITKSKCVKLEER